MERWVSGWAGEWTEGGGWQVADVDGQQNRKGPLGPVRMVEPGRSGAIGVICVMAEPRSCLV